MRLTLRSLLDLLAVVATLAAIGCTASGQTPERAAGGRGGSGSPAVPVATAKVEQKAVPLDIRVIGSAEAYSNVAVHPQITGQLTSVDFKEGEDVKKGEIIFTLDFRPLEAALEQAKANLARDTAQAVNARASSARYQDLQGRGIATKEQADQSRTSADALDATVEADRAAVDNAKVQLQYATIMAPISGRTGVLMVHEETLSSQRYDAADRHQSGLPIYVSFGIPEGQLRTSSAYLAQGSIAWKQRRLARPRLRGQSLSSTTRVDPTTAKSNQGIFSNEDRKLWPGQFVNVTLTLKIEPNAIVVPTAAVRMGSRATMCFVLKPDRTVELRGIAVERETAEAQIVGTA